MLNVEQWPIERLIPYARNPRKNDAQVDRMCAAIREFGFRPIPDDDPTRRVPDIGKASALLGFKPTTSLDEGLELTIPYYINLLGGVL